MPLDFTYDEGSVKTFPKGGGKFLRIDKKNPFAVVRLCIFEHTVNSLDHEMNLIPAGIAVGSIDQSWYRLTRKHFIAGAKAPVPCSRWHDHNQKIQGKCAFCEAAEKKQEDGKAKNDAALKKQGWKDSAMVAFVANVMTEGGVKRLECSVDFLKAITTQGQVFKKAGKSVFGPEGVSLSLQQNDDFSVEVQRLGREDPLEPKYDWAGWQDSIEDLLLVEEFFPNEYRDKLKLVAGDKIQRDVAEGDPWGEEEAPGVVALKPGQELTAKSPNGNRQVMYIEFLGETNGERFHSVSYPVNPPAGTVAKKFRIPESAIDLASVPPS